MVQSFDRNERFQIRETFEIKNEYETGHEQGLVVVLARRVLADPSSLIGNQAVIHTTDEHSIRLTIDDAKDHLKATSLFFRSKGISDVPMSSEITIE